MALTLRARCLIGFLTVAVMALLPSLYQLYQSRRIYAEIRTIVDRSAPIVETLARMSSHVTETLVADHASGREGHLTDLQADLAVYQSLVLDAARSARLQPRVEEFMRQALVKDPSSAELRRAAAAISAVLIDSVKEEVTRREMDLLRVQQESQRGIAVQHLWSVITLLSTGLLAVLFSERVSRPLRQLLDTLSAKNILSSDQGDYRGKDEASKLDECIEVLAAKLEAATTTNAAIERMIDSMDDAVFVLDRNGFVTRANRTAVNTAGDGETPVIGSPLRSTPALKPLDEMLPKNSRSTRVKGSFTLEREGTVHTFEAVASPIVRPDGDFAGTVIVARDETSRLELELALNRERGHLVQAERLAAVGTMGAIIAHKFSQPLSSVRLFLQQARRALKDVECPPVVTQNIDECLNEISQAADLVKHLLATAKPNQPADSEVVDIGEAVKRAARALSDKIVTAGAQVLHDSIPSNLFLTRGPAVQVEEVFFTLIGNAIQAECRDGKPTVEITAEESTAYTIVSLKDNCIGIPPEHLDHIFDCFFTTKGPERGTGLGLAIAKQIMKSVGGDVTVQSAVGKGTTFTLRFPTLRSFEEARV